ncbi:hypothetical protein T310_9973, partial [Rasamsonia emersonii CBS 393.64]
FHINQRLFYKKLRQFEQRPETLDNNESSPSISTPQSARKIQKIGTQILYLLPDYAIFHRLVERLVKGAIATAHLAKQLEEDLNNTKAVEQARRERQNVLRMVCQSGGVLYAHQARRIYKKRDEDEVQKATRGVRAGSRAGSSKTQKVSKTACD